MKFYDLKERHCIKIKKEYVEDNAKYSDTN